MVKDDSLKYL